MLLNEQKFLSTIFVGKPIHSSSALNNVIKKQFQVLEIAWIKIQGHSTPWFMEKIQSCLSLIGLGYFCVIGSIVNI